MGPKATKLLKLAKAAGNAAGRVPGKAGEKLQKLADMSSILSKQAEKASHFEGEFKDKLDDEISNLSIRAKKAKTEIAKGNLAAAKKALKGSKNLATNMGKHAIKYKKYQDDSDKVQRMIDPASAALQAAIKAAAKAGGNQGAMDADPNRKHGVNF